MRRIDTMFKFFVCLCKHTDASPYRRLSLDVQTGRPVTHAGKPPKLMRTTVRDFSSQF